MKLFVGTSGWYYPWNEGGSLEWFASNSNLNAVELNASFYRFPFPNMVSSWSKKGRSLRWAVKVSRLVTHVHKFNENAFEAWGRFLSLFKPLEEKIDFYLFQLPPSTTPTSAPSIERFIKKIQLGERFALEVRNDGWYERAWVEWAEGLGVTWVSTDSPDFPRDVYNTSGIVYERMHGRSGWYSHSYSDKELKEVLEKILKANPKKAYVFFNNNHAMLENARRMRELGERILK